MPCMCATFLIEKQLKTCFDHNFSKSTNFFAIKTVPSSALLPLQNATSKTARFLEKTRFSTVARRPQVAVPQPGKA